MDFIEKMVRQKFEEGYRDAFEQYKIKFLQQLNDSVKNDSVEEIEQFVKAIIYVLEDAVTEVEIIEVFKHAGKEDVGRSIMEKIRDVGRIDSILSLLNEIWYITQNTPFFK